jgi:hypothetical protein
MHDVYLSMSKRSAIARAKSLNTNWMHLHTDEAPLLRHMLEGLGLWRLVCFNQDYCPELVQQLYCTIYYHKIGTFDITWMCGNHKISSTKLDFATSLSGTQLFEHEEDLLFCYPADKRSKPGVISSMYPAYRQLAYVLKDTICQKAGDYSAIPGHMVNIMRLAHHDTLRPVDGIDFIWQEIHNEFIERRSPAYAPYLHRFFMTAARALV